MTDQMISNKRRAPLPNVIALATLVRRVSDRALGQPGMASFTGPSGFGKTEAAIYSKNKYQAVYVQVGDSWTKKKLCTAILTEAGIKPKATVADMIDQICAHLAMTDRPLIIDEADVLLRRGMIETAREIYEGSQAPVILVGEEDLPQNLQPIERVHGRMLDWVQAQPGTAADLELLIPIYCAGVTLDDDLKADLFKAVHGSIRRMAVNLTHVREHALMKGETTVTRESWGKQSFFSGVAPASRRGLVGRDQ